ncbi:MAG: glycosyltransferase [Ignavibacteriae bacterium]|nr:glycosyltransferase [Ignavibacteriota bacterium]
MNRNVLHFVRKTSQLKATFINDQITKHERYNPFVVVKERIEKLYDGGFADFDFEKSKVLLLDQNKDFSYKYRKKICNPDKIRIFNYIRENNISILHFHYGTDAGLYYEIMKESKLPSVVSFYGYDASSFPKAYFGLGKVFLKKRVFKNATRVLAMSEDMKKDFMNIGCEEEKIIVHYYGVNGEIYFYPERKYTDKEKVILLDVCSLVPQKGHLFLLKGINELVKKGIKNFELRIVGTGEMKSSLINFVRENNLKEYVIFLGAMKAHSEEILREYKNAEIFVHPSVIPENGDKEGIPGTISEAMFSGLPVVSTYHAGIPYIIEDGKTGLLVKEWDLGKLSDAILLLINDVNIRERIGRSAQKNAKENLDLKLREEELEKIYDSLIIINF